MINYFQKISLTVLVNSYRSNLDRYSPFRGPYRLKYSFKCVKMNHFFYPLAYTNILRTPFRELENIFFRPFFALIFNFEDPHSPKYAKSTYNMNMFFDPTQFIFKMRYFRRSLLEKNFNFLVVTITLWTLTLGEVNPGSREWLQMKAKGHIFNLNS
jgi:hypothetical protein